MAYASIGGYREGTSPLHRTDALYKLIAMLLTLAAVILTDTVWGYLLLTLALLSAVRISALGLRSALSGIRYMRWFFVLIFLMNAFFHEEGSALWSWWIFRLSTSGMIAGAHVVIRVMLALVLGQLLCSVTSPQSIVGAIESMLFPLHYLRVPVQDIAMILGAAMQFIPIFFEETEMIRRAQTARGARFESKNPVEKARSLLPLVVPVFLSAFRRADELSVAMEARGYRRHAGRLPRKKHPADRTAAVLLILSAALCLTAIPL